MRGQQHRRPLPRQIGDDAVKLAPQRRVQPRGRLVQQQQPGRSQQRLRQPQPLAHALGIGSHRAVGGLGQPDAGKQRIMARCRQTLEPGVKGQRLAPGKGQMELHAFGQIAQGAPRATAMAGIGTQNRQPPAIGPGQAQHHLDLRRLAGAVMADQRHHLPGMQGIAEIADHAAARIDLADIVQDDSGFGIAHGRGLSEFGNISGWLSVTPPGNRPGKRPWAKRRICTAGLVSSSRACGAVHITLSTMSLGR